MRVNDAGVWATLQFKWVQLQYPVVVVAFEKLLVGGCLPVAATVQAWGVIAALGLAAAPFCLAPILAVLYCLFAMPLPSSFATGSRRKGIGQLCTDLALHVSPLHLHVSLWHESLLHVPPLHVSCLYYITFACITSACVCPLCHSSVKGLRG